MVAALISMKKNMFYHMKTAFFFAVQVYVWVGQFQSYVADRSFAYCQNSSTITVGCCQVQLFFSPKNQAIIQNKTPQYYANKNWNKITYIRITYSYIRTYLGFSELTSSDAKISEGLCESEKTRIVAYHQICMQYVETLELSYHICANKMS